jgi:dihydroorotate dehydrogenase electron transfer subunit
MDFLYKPVGAGLRELAKTKAGRSISILGPIGNGFVLDPSRPSVLAIGGGVGIPPMIFLGEALEQSAGFAPLILMGSEVPFPFELVPAKLARRNLPTAVNIAKDALSLASLESLGIPSLLASNAGIAGAEAAFVTDLARRVLSTRNASELAATQVVACGPEPMLAAAARLAAQFSLPCKLALEEFMACAVGGCAGCTVLVHGSAGPAMRRVCVDGPVFEASEIYPPTAA